MTDTSAIRKERDAAYGDPSVSLGAIGRMWREYLFMRWGIPLPYAELLGPRYLAEMYDHKITPDMVADMMILMKVMRRANPSCPGIKPHIYHEGELRSAIDRIKKDCLSPLEDCGQDIAVYADIATETDARIKNE